MKKHLTAYWKYYFLIIIIFASIFWSLVKINEPFLSGHLGGKNARQGVFNQNVIKNGYLEIKFGELSSYQKDKRCIRNYAYNHPSLAYIINSVPALVLGNKEWVIRIIPLLFFLFNLFLLFKIFQNIFDSSAGILASIIYAFLPVNRLYNTLSDFYGPMFFTFIFLIIFFILKYEQSEKRRYKYGFLIIYFLSLLYDWLFIINGFIILLYFLFFRKKDNKEVYQILFFLLFLTNIGFLLNFLHIYWLTGNFHLEGLINQFLYRKGSTNYLFSFDFFYKLWKSFGTIPMLGAIIGIFVLTKINNKKFIFLFSSQCIVSLFFLLFFNQALEFHWYIFMNFSLLITLSLISFFRFFRKTLFVAVILFLIILSSELFLYQYRQGKFDRIDLEFHNEFLSVYTLMEQFTKTKEYPPETLVLLGYPGYYIADYYLSTKDYCFEVYTNKDNPKYFYKDFKKVIFINLDRNKKLMVEKIK